MCNFFNKKHFLSDKKPLFYRMILSHLDFEGKRGGGYGSTAKQMSMRLLSSVQSSVGEPSEEAVFIAQEECVINALKFYYIYFNILPSEPN